MCTILTRWSIILVVVVVDDVVAVEVVSTGLLGSNVFGIIYATILIYL